MRRCSSESKHGDEAARTEISGEEIGDVNLEDLIEEEHDGGLDLATTATSSARRRAPTGPSAAAARGSRARRSTDDDPIEHLFVTSTHDYLLFFTNYGKVYWQKVYNLPELARDAKGRAVVNLLNLEEGEKIADCRAVRDFNAARPLPDDGHAQNRAW